MECIKTICWHTYRIPLRANFATAHSVITAREGAIVEIVTEGGLSGFGEIAPLPSFAGSDLSTALAPLPILAQQLSGKELVAALDFLYAQLLTLPATTICGLECALLDALGKMRVGAAFTTPAIDRTHLAPQVRDTEVGAAFTTPAIDRTHRAPQIGDTQKSDANPSPIPIMASIKRRVPVNTVIGTQDIEMTTKSAHEAVEAGYSCIKLKMGNNDPNIEIARIAAVRNAIGPAIHLRLDANEAWTLAQAITILNGCAFYDIQYVEQPLPASDLDGMRTLCSTVPVAIAADEGVHDLESARRVLASEAAQILIIKPQLAGGLRVGRQIITEAAQRGVKCVITSTIETGIGLVGALHLAAASPEVTLECGLATLPLLADDLLVDALTIDNSFLGVPTGPGLGIELDRNALARYTTG